MDDWRKPHLQFADEEARAEPVLLLGEEADLARLLRVQEAGELGDERVVPREQLRHLPEQLRVRRTRRGRLNCVQMGGFDETQSGQQLRLLSRGGKGNWCEKKLCAQNRRTLMTLCALCWDAGGNLSPQRTVCSPLPRGCSTAFAA